MSKEDLSLMNMRVLDLKVLLKDQNLPTSGRKVELVNRI